MQHTAGNAIELNGGIDAEVYMRIPGGLEVDFGTVYTCAIDIYYSVYINERGSLIE